MEKLEFIQQRRPLFWSVSDEKLSEISDELLVENLLNYGSLEDVKALLNLLGLEKVAAIFLRTSRRTRHNYQPEVVNFFSLYFNRHANRHSD